MVKKRTIKKNKVMVGVTCQCQEPAVARPPTHLRRTQCKVCGNVFKTNRESIPGKDDVCLNCKNKK